MISRSYGSVSPVARRTSRRSRSIAVARVFSQGVIRFCSYQTSGMRYRPCIADRPWIRRVIAMRL
jgi:hypothetical protein